MKNIKVTALASAAAIALAAQPAFAAEAPSGTAPEAVAADDDQPDGGLSEIIVTVERRTESLQRTAIAVTAIGGDELLDAGVSEATGLSKLVPALQVQPTGGSGTSFYLRGVGTQSGNSFAENAVAFNFNGVYVARPTAPAGTFFDLQRVEVVKGPQGTLYGRNATGGAINILPARPVLGEFSGNMTLEYGNYDNKRGSAALNLGLGESAALRLATQIVDRDGYLSDGYDDEVGKAFRASVLIEPSVDWSMLVVADYFDQGGKGPGNVLIPGAGFAAPDPSERIGGSDPIAQAAAAAAARPLPAPPFCGGPGNFVNSGCVRLPQGDGFLDNTFWGVSAQIEGNLGFGTLTMLPAYRRTETNFRMYLPGFLGETSDTAEQMSLEVRLASNADQAFRYVMGGFYYSEDQSAENFFAQGDLSTTRFAPNLNTESIAAFGQFTYDLTDTLRLVAGGRYTREDKSQFTRSAAGGRPGPVNPPLGTPFSGELSFEKFTWKAGVEWDAGPASLVYANVATGFKTGGFFVANPPDNTFAPESLTAYTLGTKNRFFGNKLQINLEAFYWDYTDQQVSFVGGVRTASGQFASGGVTVNAGKSRIYGAELEFAYQVFNRGRLTANVQYLNGKYDSLFTSIFSNTGAPVPTGCTVVASRLANPGVNNARFFDTDCSGKPTIQSPEWTGNIGYEHIFALGGDMELVANARTNISSGYFLDVNFIEREKQGSFMTSDVLLTLNGPDDRWSLSGYVNNIENETIFARAGNRPILNISYATLRAPRTYGARLTFRF